MDLYKWLTALPQFLVLLPSAASCYYAMKNQMRHSPARTAALCGAVLFPYSLLCAWACVWLGIAADYLFLPSLALLFFAYRRTVTANLPKCLAVYVGVCAVQSFPAQFAYAFDAHLHPDSGAADFSVEAAFFQLGLSCLIAAAMAWPTCRHFYRMVDRLDSPKIWYSTVALSAVFLLLNVLMIPHSYSTIHVGWLPYIFPILEACSLAVLLSIYLLFYQSATVMLERADLKVRSQLLEMQAEQYRTLQNYMSQTRRLRHDFRHSVGILMSLAAKGDLESLKAHLREYEQQFGSEGHAVYCANAALNALFNYYHGMAEAAEVDIDWRIALPDPLTVSELDLAGMFGNLLENGIAGCLSVRPAGRYFSLSAQVRQNRLYVVSTNSFDGRTRKSQEGYLSTKRDGKGIGLASVQAVAEKYGGTAKFSNSDREFFADVVLKL